MQPSQHSHYRVIQYVDQWPLGRQRVVLKEGLTLDEARHFRMEEDLNVPHEEVTIESEETGEEITDRNDH